MLIIEITISIKFIVLLLKDQSDIFVLVTIHTDCIIKLKKQSRTKYINLIQITHFWRGLSETLLHCPLQRINKIKGWDVEMIV